MESGYLLVEADSAHPGMVRLFVADALPPDTASSEAKSGSRICYAAWFADLNTARMHAHSLLRHTMVDADSGLYRVDPQDAVAAVDSLGLRHRRSYLDPHLSGRPELAIAVAAYRRRRQRVDRTWRIVGIAAVLFLLIQVLLGH